MKSINKYFALAILVCLVSTWELSAQTKSKSKSRSTSQSKAKQVESRGRLPKYFAHLKLKEEQREEVFSVQSKYKKEIADLTKELENLKESQQEDLYDILSRTQKTLYNKYVAGTLKVGESSSKKESSGKPALKSKASRKTSRKSTSSGKKKSSRSKSK